MRGLSLRLLLGLLTLSLVASDSAAWYPLTHILMAKRMGVANGNFFRGTQLPDSDMVVQNLGWGYHNEMHSRETVDYLYRNLNGTGDVYVFEGYFHHVYVDYAENEYTRAKAQEFMQKHPQYSSALSKSGLEPALVYKEVLGASVDRWALREDPDILNDFLSTTDGIPPGLAARMNLGSYESVNARYVTNTFLFYHMNALGFYGVYFNMRYRTALPNSFWESFVDDGVGVVEGDIGGYLRRINERTLIVDCFSSGGYRYTNASKAGTDWGSRCVPGAKTRGWVEPPAESSKNNYPHSILMFLALNASRIYSRVMPQSILLQAALWALFFILSVHYIIPRLRRARRTGHRERNP